MLCIVLSAGSSAVLLRGVLGCVLRAAMMSSLYEYCCGVERNEHYLP
jgi:hypothetical protein